jgi:hypothetical protein
MTLLGGVAVERVRLLGQRQPEVPHPRWSQATERVLGTDERRPTLLCNGYGEFVADLYKDLQRREAVHVKARDQTNRGSGTGLLIL